MINPLTIFHKLVIAPLVEQPPAGGKAVGFLSHVRAASITVAFLMAPLPMVDGVVGYVTSNGPLGSTFVMIGCVLWFFCFGLPYPIARFWLKRPHAVLCDVIALGSLVSAILWDIGSPTLIPLGLSSMFAAAFAGWCGTARGHVTVAIAAVFIMYQCYNTILWHGDIKDRGDFYRDLAAQCFAAHSNSTSVAFNSSGPKTSFSCYGPLPEFKSRFPQHLFVEDYYFPGVAAGGASSTSTSADLVARTTPRSHHC